MSDLKTLSCDCASQCYYNVHLRWTTIFHSLLGGAQKNMLFPLDFGCHVSHKFMQHDIFYWNLRRKSFVVGSDLSINDEHPLGQIVGKGAFFGLNLKSYWIFDGHFLFPREILTGCCRWRCLTFSGCSDGFSICHGQGHRSHRTVMGRGCQNWSKMARHFPYYLTTAVRLQNKTKRMPCEIYTLCLRNLPTYLRIF